MYIKQLTRFFFFVFTYLLMSVIFYSCCGDDYSRLKGIDQFYSYQPGHATNAYGDTITSNFQLHVSFEVEYLTFHELDLIQSAYAFQPCPREIVNPIDNNSIRLTLDKDFFFGEQKVTTGNSLLELEGVHLLNYINEGAPLSIHFDSAFISNATFSKDWYIFSISMNNFDTIPETFTANDTLFMNFE